MKWNDKWKRYVTKEGLLYKITARKHFENAKLVYVEIKPHPKNGYYFISRTDENGVRISTSIHRLVWETYNGPIPQGYEIDHIDGDKSNNALSNLRCVTHKENMANHITKEKQRKIYDSVEWRTKVSNGNKGKPRKAASEFGRKFKEHFGENADMKLYKYHNNFYRAHGYCKWEVEDAAN